MGHRNGENMETMELSSKGEHELIPMEQMTARPIEHEEEDDYCGTSHSSISVDGVGRYDEEKDDDDDDEGERLLARQKSNRGGFERSYAKARNKLRCIYFLGSFAYSIYLPFFVLFMKNEIGLSAGEVGLVGALQIVGGYLVGPPVSLLVDWLYARMHHSRPADPSCKQFCLRACHRHHGERAECACFFDPGCIDPGILGQRVSRVRENTILGRDRLGAGESHGRIHCSVLWNAVRLSSLRSWHDCQCSHRSLAGLHHDPEGRGGQQCWQRWQRRQQQRQCALSPLDQTPGADLELRALPLRSRGGWIWWFEPSDSLAHFSERPWSPRFPGGIGAVCGHHIRAAGILGERLRYQALRRLLPSLRILVGPHRQVDSGVLPHKPLDGSSASASAWLHLRGHLDGRSRAGERNQSCWSRDEWAVRLQPFLQWDRGPLWSHRWRPAVRPGGCSDDVQNQSNDLRSNCHSVRPHAHKAQVLCKVKPTTINSI